ncbi:MAG: hypothetical protein JOZ08_08105 [Verrucomicrobia bacterium]|nr:hypothetical protein [Verrucomicrobiota bacterium]MBV8275399.1 hypothetical protein [Verrucomicrobiota bacterium]
MNSDAAKEVLSAYRSGDRDGADPFFHEALKQMESDSELKKWFDEQHDLDRAIREKLASIEPPPDLQAKILARIRGEKVRRFALPQVWLAAAACLLVGGIAWFYSAQKQGPDRFQEFKTDALAMVSAEGGPVLDLWTSNITETQSYLREHQAPYDEWLPNRLKSMETAGCRAFVWKDYPASLTCFRLPDGMLLHLVVIHREAMGNANIPVGMKSMGDWHLMFQQKDGMLMMWATQAPMEQLKQIVVKIAVKPRLGKA